MALLKEYLAKELRTMIDNNVRFRPIGRLTELEPEIQEGLKRTVEATASNTGLVFQIALNYSGRTELVDLARTAALAVRGGSLSPEGIDEAWVAEHLSTTGVPDPDLLIRTSGELRISNFLLWQIAYAELHFTPVLWPDFTTRDLLLAVADYARRERRYGGVVEPGQDVGDEAAE
jgi:undecaprenyl diphosphate synthase